MHTDTWHSTQGLGAITHTEMGSKPGDPLGDIVFDFLASRVLYEIDREAHEAGLIHDLPGTDTSFGSRDGSVKISMFDSAFMDDCLFYLLNRCPVSLLEMLRQLAFIATKVFCGHGPILNFRAGKSEAMVFIRGPRSS